MAKKSAPKLVRQVSLRPGRYFNKRTGQYNLLTPQELREYAAGTTKLIAAGYEPPLRLEHDDPASPEGKPKNRRDAKADELRNTVGWLKAVAVGGDGAAEFSYEVTDSEIAKKFEEGSLKFVSPELLQTWTDGKGVVHEKITSHLAITNRPKSADQSPPEVVGALQFSLEDWEPVQFADDEPFEKKKKPEDGGGPPSEGSGDPPKAKEEPAEEENADLNKITGGGGDHKRKQNIEALIAALEHHGISLPADTIEAEEEQLIDRLLTALMTAVSIEGKIKGEQAETQNEQGPSGQQTKRPEVVEQRGVMQYSIGDIESGVCTNKLLSKFIRQEHKAIVDRIDDLVKSGTLSPAAKKKLLTPEALQFSTEGELSKTFTLEEVVDLLADVIPKRSAWTPDEVAEQFSMEDHPDGPKHYTGDEKADAKSINDEMARKMPGMFKESAGAR